MTTVFKLFFPRYDLREEPRDDASLVAPTVFDWEEMTRLSVRPVSGVEWAEVELKDPARRGFIPADDLMAVQVRPRPRPKIEDKSAYLATIAAAAVRHGVSRDYLACIAQMESGMANPAPKRGSEIEGPFQFLRETWNALAAEEAREGRPFPIRESDIVDPIAQAFMAARLAATDIRKLAPALATPGGETATGRVPTGAELYIGHMLGLGAALDFLRARTAGGGATKVDSLLQAHYGSRKTKSGADYWRAVFEGNKRLLASGGAARSLDGVIEAIEAEFDKASAALAPVYAGLPADMIRASTPQAGEPGWLKVARDELGVGETNAPGRVREFHAATGAPDEPATPWCASFICWCLKTSGDARAAASALTSKRAANWLDWASPAGETPMVGDLLVTHPLARGASGHVGWLVAYAPGAGATIIGGNQGKPGAVTEMRVKPADIRAFRRLA